LAALTNHTAMNMKSICTATVVFGMMLASCSKDNSTVGPATNPGTDNGQAGMTYELRAVNTTTGINQKVVGAGTLRWTSGYANPTQIKFEAKSKDTKIEYKSTNTTRIDLFTPVAPGFGYFVLPAGTYKEIELKMKLDNVGPDPALFLAGNYTNNGVVYPVIFRVDDELEIKTELKDVTIDNTGSMAAITNLDLAGYSAGVTESMFRNAELTNGTIIISEASNRDLYRIMKSNLSGKRHKCEYKKRH
jgi:hypothetical protein